MKSARKGPGLLPGFFIGEIEKAGQERDKMTNQRKMVLALIAETLAMTGADARI